MKSKELKTFGVNCEKKSSKNDPEVSGFSHDQMFEQLHSSSAFARRVRPRLLASSWEWTWLRRSRHQFKARLLPSSVLISEKASHRMSGCVSTRMFSTSCSSTTSSSVSQMKVQKVSSSQDESFCFSINAFYRKKVEMVMTDPTGLHWDP